MVTAVWLSSAVENTWVALVGMVVFLSISRVITRPRVSMPRDSGVTSSSSTSLTSPDSTPALDGRADGDRLVGIDVLAGLLAEEVADFLLDLGHADLAAHQDHVVHVGHLQPGIVQRRAAGIQREPDQVLDHGLELSPGSG